MWALIESGNISKIFTRPTQVTIGDIKYPRNIFQLWSESELKAIGIYTVVIDNTNLKDSKYYINTNQSFNFASDTVTASYGTATALPLDNVLFTAQDETDGLGTEGDVKQKGIRQGHIDTINAQAGSILLDTDWMVIREADGGTAMPSNIKTWRASVRTKANAMCTQIDNAADVDALAALYVYNDATPPVRPLGEFPELS
jgi:hypothetical protein